MIIYHIGKHEIDELPFSSLGSSVDKEYNNILCRGIQANYSITHIYIFSHSRF